MNILLIAPLCFLFFLVWMHACMLECVCVCMYRMRMSIDMDMQWQTFLRNTT